MKKLNPYRAERRAGVRPARSRSAAFVITIVIALLLSACASASSTTPIPTVILDSSNNSSNNQSNQGNSVSASAIVVPVVDTQLSFPATGRVTNVNVQVGDVVKKGQVLVELDRSILEAKVKEAEANLAYSEIQLKYLIRVAGCRIGCAPTEERLDVAENDVAHAQALLDSAKAVLASQSALTAPFDGTIVSVDISPAETVVPGQVVIVLGDLSSYQVQTTDLSERDVTKVQVGDSAKVFIEALNEEFSGKVVDIDRIGATLGGDVVFTVTIDLDHQPEGLLWGMSADVSFDSNT
ncbi:MAG TPA: efflux RND transporter periplasmic adaptor subunit [Anaerolineales bacterium]|nr:efflux RND transporter periplasmic adaptor subunit [Anaerolineales bacterium]